MYTMTIFSSRGLIVLLSLVLFGCGGGDGGGGTTNSSSSRVSSVSSSSESSISVSSSSESSSSESSSSSSSSESSSSSSSSVGPVTIAGTLTYDFVPATTGGLDYGSIVARPIRSAVVELLNGGDTVIDTTNSDLSGDYSFEVSMDTQVRVRVKAQSLQTGSPSWNFLVEDNTDGNAVYALQGSLVSSGTTNSTRDLHAASGWGGSSYNAERAAGPFAILDTVYTALLVFLEADANVQFPIAHFRWSPNNTTASGNLADGDIGTSFYSNGALYILGAENSDTDEYDRHVIVHEWGHYVEDKLSRADSIGGSHGAGDKLDMRVAMSEGFATALASIMLSDPIYKDTLSTQQSFASHYDISTVIPANRGWYSELSVQALLYNYAQVRSFDAIYDVMTHASYKEATSLISIFTFADRFTDLASGSDVSAFITQYGGQNITSFDEFGIGEVDDGGVASILPLYASLTANGSVLNVCSHSDAGKGNKIGVHKYIRLTIPSNNTYTVTMQKNGGAAIETDPDFYVLLKGEYWAVAEGSDVDVETKDVGLNAGEHIIAATDWVHANPSGGAAAATCFDISVTPN